ncbi:MAG: hypothetical protein GF334_08435, partial [Candidatus Altiarchaeales archaeon]|nr:hypothetical protein [Candidatus Altiarchaeales archaeon]
MGFMSLDGNDIEWGESSGHEYEGEALFIRDSDQDRGMNNHTWTELVLGKNRKETWGPVFFLENQSNVDDFDSYEPSVMITLTKNSLL